MRTLNKQRSPFAWVKRRVSLEIHTAHFPALKCASTLMLDRELTIHPPRRRGAAAYAVCVPPVDPDCLLAGGRPVVKAAKTARSAGPL